MRKRRLASRLAMIFCFLVVVAGVCLQLSRAAVISANAKKMAACRASIEQLTIDTQHLEIQISAKASLDRVRDLAHDLGMVIPGAEQIRLVSLPAGFGDTAVVQVSDGPNAG